MSLALMESAHSPPHHVFGLLIGPRPQRAHGNAGAIFARLAEPKKHIEAITSRPLLLSSVGKLTESSRQKTLTITHSHGRARKVQIAYQRVLHFFEQLKTNAPQLMELECWCRILSEAMKKYLGGEILKPPNRLVMVE